ncbi:MAG: apolipoprotein N-acyltransferase [Candidatus Omnitrophica bacterium]|nr:apolipoprotein N-acyltransferase [Candidatus Omnitrophota bacterium]
MIISSPKIRDILLCLASAALITLSFPKTDCWILAWGALVPFFFAIEGKKPKEAFKTGFLFGALLFLGTLYWFFNITRWFSFIAGFGVGLLILYLALYPAFFGLFYTYFSNKKIFGKLILIPCLWVALEFIRARALSGFGWVSFGYSQYRNLYFAQIADMTGVYGVSFAIVLTNVALKSAISEYMAGKSVLKAAKIILPALVILALVFSYGYFKVKRDNNAIKNRKTQRVGIVQPNILQDDKWHQEKWEGIIGKLDSLSSSFVRGDVEMIVWPESIVPAVLEDDIALKGRLHDFVSDKQIPLLYGINTREGDKYYNSAVLLSADSQQIASYSKIHLVPFGEYLPFRKELPFLSDLVPIGDFTFGKEYVLFPFPGEKELFFSVLICFEDTVETLARKAVQKGAGFLVNITNDAWFGDSKEPFLHLQAAVFRAIENNRFMARSANTGVSCFIDNMGRVYNAVSSKGKRLVYSDGTSAGGVIFIREMTFYTKFGDIFTYLCFGCILISVILKLRKF